MRLATSSNTAAIGNVEIYEKFRVIELDAGHDIETTLSSGINGSSDSIPFSPDALNAIEKRLAIVVPCKDEDVSILDGVLHGITHDCLIILVSNSKGANFEAECNLLTNFCTDTKRPGIVTHQHDAGIAKAFIAAGLPDIVSESVRASDQGPQIRNGKGEAMMIGTAIAKLAGKQFVGFIDADNLVAGAVHEYCKVYAAGLHYALHCTDQPNSSETETPHVMVRIKWNSKPKVKNGELVFETSGRSSRVVNEWMNRLLKALLGDNDQNAMIQTGNAGEHAMSIDFALELQFATGYAVEPAQFIDAWERLGGSLPLEILSRIMKSLRYDSDDLDDEGKSTLDDNSSSYTPGSSLAPSSTASVVSTPESSRPQSVLMPTPASQTSTLPSIRILQVETRNPHFHDTSKGADHISAMQAGGLSTIYHSRLAPQTLKDELRQFFKENLADVKGVAEDGTPKPPRSYPAMQLMDFGIFRTQVKAHSETLKIVGECSNTCL
jgi:mannosyl-3-phosphoglycerate synthase